MRGRFAETPPLRLRRLCLTGVSADRGARGRLALQSWRSSLRAGDLEGFAWRLLLDTYSPATLAAQEANIKSWCAMLSLHSAEGLRGIVERTHTEDEEAATHPLAMARAMMETTHAPESVLLMNGVEDLLCAPGAGEALRAQRVISGRTENSRAPATRCRLSSRSHGGARSSTFLMATQRERVCERGDAFNKFSSSPDSRKAVALAAQRGATALPALAQRGATELPPYAVQSHRSDRHHHGFGNGSAHGHRRIAYRRHIADRRWPNVVAVMASSVRASRRGSAVVLHARAPCCHCGCGCDCGCADRGRLAQAGRSERLRAAAAVAMARRGQTGQCLLEGCDLQRASH